MARPLILNYEEPPTEICRLGIPDVILCRCFVPSGTEQRCTLYGAATLALPAR